MSPVAVVSGDWCFGATLWGNPLLPDAFTDAVRQVCNARGVSMYTVGDLLFYRDWVHQGVMNAETFFMHRDCGGLLNALPLGWRAAATACLHRVGHCLQRSVRLRLRVPLCRALAGESQRTQRLILAP